MTGFPSAISDAGGSFTLSIAAPSDCSWTASSTEAWARIARASGQGNGSVELTVERNEVRNPRTLNVRVNAQTMSAVQSAAQCVFTVTPGSLDVTFNTTPVTISLSASMADCSWTASADESWLRPRVTNGTGNASIVIDIDEHRATTPRHASLTIAGQRVAVTQQPR